MAAYAQLIKLLLVAGLAAGLAFWGRGCGKEAGLAAGAKERTALQEEVVDLTGRLNGCITSLNFANNIADQAAAEAIRQQDRAEQAVRRAEQAEKDAARRVSNLQAELARARSNPDAAAQLDLELHPSIPLL